MTALAKLSFLEQSYDQARQEFEHIVDYLDSKETSGMTHSELERALEKKGRELMRKLLQEHLITAVQASATTHPWKVQMELYGRVFGFKSGNLRRCLELSR